MTDTIYRGPISDSDTESETHAVTDQPVASWSKFKDELESGVDRDELSVEDATEETLRRRQEAPTPENASERPITRLRSKGGAQTLKQASEDLGLTRGLAKRQELLEAGYNEKEIQQFGLGLVESAERGDSRNEREPPAKVEIPREFGETGDEPLDPHEAADKITAWRAEQERQRQAELSELTGELEARQQQRQDYEQQPTEQQQPQQPTPAELERQQVAIERQRTEAIKQISFAEVGSLNNLAQLSQQVQQAFPELANVRTEQDLHALHAHLQRQNPARAQALARADQVVRQRQTALAYLTGQRKAHEIHQQQAASQQREAMRARQDADFERRASQIVGAERWRESRGEVQAQARKTLEAAGLNQQQISDLWHGSDSLDAHSAVLQEVLLKASMWDSAKAKAEQVRQTPLPRVLRPGVGNFSRGSGDNVAEIRARMRSAKGGDGLKLGVALLKAQRASRS